MGNRAIVLTVSQLAPQMNLYLDDPSSNMAVPFHYTLYTMSKENHHEKQQKTKVQPPFFLKRMTSSYEMLWASSKQQAVMPSHARSAKNLNNRDFVDSERAYGSPIEIPSRHGLHAYKYIYKDMYV